MNTGPKNILVMVIIEVYSIVDRSKTLTGIEVLDTHILLLPNPRVSTAFKPKPEYLQINKMWKNHILLKTLYKS